MTTFSTLPPMGSHVLLGGRSVYLPTQDQLWHIRDDEQAFYLWCYLVPKTGDIITVRSRPGQVFYVYSDQEQVSRFQWLCFVRRVLVRSPEDDLSLGEDGVFIILLPGARLVRKDECTIEEVEIVGQGQQ